MSQSTAAGTEALHLITSARDAEEEPQRDDAHVEGAGCHALFGHLELVCRTTGSDPATGTRSCGRPRASSSAAALHMPRDGASYLPEILGRASPLPAQSAEDGARPQTGRVTVVPPGQQLCMGAERVWLRPCNDSDRFCPSIDVLMRSSADAHGDRVAAAVLTGYLDDGAAGLADVQRAGGTTIVQEPREAEADGMPSSALAVLQPDYVLPFMAIPPVLPWLTDPAPRRAAYLHAGRGADQRKGLSFRAA